MLGLAGPKPTLRVNDPVKAVERALAASVPLQGQARVAEQMEYPPGADSIFRDF